MESKLISKCFQERVSEHMTFNQLFEIKQQLDLALSMLDIDMQSGFEDFNSLLFFNSCLSQVVADVALYHIYPERKEEKKQAE